MTWWHIYSSEDRHNIRWWILVLRTLSSGSFYKKHEEPLTELIPHRISTMVLPKDGAATDMSYDNKDEILDSDIHVEPVPEPYTEDQYHKLRKRVDWIMMPVLLVTYGLQYSDKQSVGRKST